MFRKGLSLAASPTHLLSLSIDIALDLIVVLSRLASSQSRSAPPPPIAHRVYFSRFAEKTSTAVVFYPAGID